MHMDMSKEPVYAEFHEKKKKKTNVSRTFCANPRGRNALGLVTKIIL